MIEAAARFGYRVFYGDASRLDLLRTQERPRQKSSSLPSTAKTSP